MQNAVSFGEKFVEYTEVDIDVWVSTHTVCKSWVVLTATADDTINTQNSRFKFQLNWNTTNVWYDSIMPLKAIKIRCGQLWNKIQQLTLHLIQCNRLNCTAYWLASMPYHRITSCTACWIKSKTQSSARPPYSTTLSTADGVWWIGQPACRRRERQRGRERAKFGLSRKFLQIEICTVCPNSIRMFYYHCSICVFIFYLFSRQILVLALFYMFHIRGSIRLHWSLGFYVCVPPHSTSCTVQTSRRIVSQSAVAHYFLCFFFFGYFVVETSDVFKHGRTQWNYADGTSLGCWPSESQRRSTHNSHNESRNNFKIMPDTKIVRCH